MKLLPVLVIAVVFAAGCIGTTEDSMKKGETMQKTISSGEAMNDTMMKGTYTGQVLAGSSAPLLDFNKADYDKASQSNKTILLYFYAAWCPICKEELPRLYGAFNELNNDKIIGFRVNFNDDQTNDDERAIARQFGVPYQHTKVLVKNGKVIGKFPDSWDKARYLIEINKSIS